jgi:choline dehydrogenase-like flavoprotein
VLDLIVVGSGAAGTWAAKQASGEGLGVLLLDVGHRPEPEEALRGSFLDLRRSDPGQRNYLIGAQFESLHNIVQEYQSPKLNAPRFRFVTQEATSLGPLRTSGFSATQSFAYGGLASAWGGGAYRYTANDLRDFPLPSRCLDGYYDEITRAIGICGEADDLAGHFGSTEGLQPPLQLGRQASYLLSCYQRHGRRFRNAGFTIGRPRLAVLTRPLGGRAACTYDNLTFWEPRLGYLYVPAWTLNALIGERKIEYRDQMLVHHFCETEHHVEVVARDLRRGTDEAFRARRVILAAGALNSARLVLQSFRDFETTQPLLDNQPSMVPFIHPRFVGEPVDTSSHGMGQLTLLYVDGDSEYVQGTYYNYTSLLGSEVILDFPLPLRGAVAACKYLLPAFSLVTFFYPDRPRSRNFVRLDSDGTLVVNYGEPVRPGALERHLIKLMRRSGFLSHPALVRIPPSGSGIHYAGTLPMQDGGGPRYSTEPTGRLRGTRAVFVADAAAFPILLAKNHTLTVMANAMRVAHEVAASLRPA